MGEQKPEILHGPEKEKETVRVAIRDSAGNYLILEKSSKSIASGMWEFPGGKIDNISGDFSTEGEQIDAAIEETKQEAGIDISGFKIEKADEFAYEFKSPSGDEIKRRVHVFAVNIDGERPEVVFGKTLNKEGKPEDFHSGYKWVSPGELNELKNSGKLLDNSTHIDNLPIN